MFCRLVWQNRSTQPFPSGYQNMKLYWRLISSNCVLVVADHVSCFLLSSRHFTVCFHCVTFRLLHLCARRSRGQLTTDMHRRGRKCRTGIFFKEYHDKRPKIFSRSSIANYDASVSKNLIQLTQLSADNSG